MKVVISTVGKFHCFDLARELEAQNALGAIFTGYPSFKLRSERLPRGRIHTFPYVHAAYMAFKWHHRTGLRFTRSWERLDRVSLDRHVAGRLPACDVFVGLSASALESGRSAKRAGARYVCDRGSSHIRTQDALLREEHARWDVPFDGVDPWIIEREEQEYQLADAITVPSSFALRSFVDRGVPADKLRLLSYGVDLSTFGKVADPDDSEFRVLFVGGMSLRKGVPYLITAFEALKHPRKKLSFAGTPSAPLIKLLRARGLWSDDHEILGHVNQARLKEVMSRSHVMVLPSVEEGLALVQAQALACGCVVIATPATGAEDLYEDGREGFIVPVRDVDALGARLQDLADSPALRRRMSAAAQARVQAMGGWDTYGRKALNIYRELMEQAA